MNVSGLLAKLIVPLYFSLALVLAALPVFFLRRPRIARWLVGTAIAWSMFWSLPASTLWTGGALERLHPYRAPEDLPLLQAMVVLGGNTANARHNWFEDIDQASAVLRTDTAAGIYHAGRAGIVVVSGASLDGGLSEAGMMAAALERDGVPPSAIIQEDHSRTTRQNATMTASVLREMGVSRFFLVTSALHMPRAMASFRKLGLQPYATPSPAQIVAPPLPGFKPWLPDWRTYQASRSIIKEYLGLLVYWLRGWA